MSNSPLVSYVDLSPNYSKRRHPISKYTIHIIAGNISLKTLGNIFKPKSRRASSNYGIDSQGNVGMYVEEKNAAWTSSSAWNDQRAVTVEVANDFIGGVWSVSKKALAKAIELGIDVCNRNNINEVNYTGSKNGNLTRHNMYSNTVCPGPYITSNLSYIEKEINKGIKRGTPSRNPSISRPQISTNNLKIDGYWGPSTTRALQKTLGTYVDGVISGQYPSSTTYSIPSVSHQTRTGSNVIKKLQKKIGARQDGYIGVKTIRALQKYLGTHVDGIISKPSLMVKELQRRLNNNTF